MKLGWLFLLLFSCTALAQTEPEPISYLITYSNGKTAVVSAADYKLVRWSSRAYVPKTKRRKFSVGVQGGVGPTHILVEKGHNKDVSPERSLVIGATFGYRVWPDLQFDGTIFSNQTYTAGLSYLLF
jgi:hypothetical protein